MFNGEVLRDLSRGAAEWPQPLSDCPLGASVTFAQQQRRRRDVKAALTMPAASGGAAHAAVSTAVLTWRPAPRSSAPEHEGVRVDDTSETGTKTGANGLAPSYMFRQA